MLIGINVDENSSKDNHFLTNEKFYCEVIDAIIRMVD